MDLNGKALVSHLKSAPLTEWTDQDWIMMAMLANNIKVSGWESATDMIPAIELIDTICTDWHTMVAQNQDLAYDIVGILTKAISDKLSDIVDALSSYREDRQLIDMIDYGSTDYDDDEEEEEDDNLPF